jgi:DNA-binding LacI/PurR family transcriptional regulator
MVTQEQIARRLGVSRTAVGLVLSGSPKNLSRVTPDLRQRIESAAREMGYVSNIAAQLLKGKPSRILGAVATSWFDSVSQRFLSWLLHEADARGHKLLTAELHDPTRAAESFHSDFGGRAVDGFIFFAWNTEKIWPQVAPVLSQQRNVVCVAGRPPIRNARFALCDFPLGDRLAMEHLHARGRRKVALVVSAPADGIDIAAEQEFLAASSRLGLSGAEQRILRLTVDAYTAEAMEQPCARIADQLTDMQCDSVITAGDATAALIMRRLRERGVRVPEDIAVVGRLNDMLAGYFDPPITTLTYRLDLLASHALDLAMDGVGKEPKPAREIVVPPELIVRKST